MGDSSDYDVIYCDPPVSSSFFTGFDEDLAQLAESYESNQANRFESENVSDMIWSQNQPFEGFEHQHRRRPISPVPGTIENDNIFVFLDEKYFKIENSTSELEGAVTLNESLDSKKEIDSELDVLTRAMNAVSNEKEIAQSQRLDQSRNNIKSKKQKKKRQLSSFQSPLPSAGSEPSIGAPPGVKTNNNRSKRQNIDLTQNTSSGLRFRL